MMVLLILLIIIIAWGNKAIEINTYQISSKKISDNFDSFRIAQISDLHNAEIGEDNKKLVSKLKSTNPDIIVITGDLIDSRIPDVDTAIGFVEEAVKIAPCYYVNGNHEARVMTEYEDLKTKLSELGVYILENKKMEELGRSVRFSFWERVDAGHTVVRFASSWATREQDVDALIALL